jgi:glutamate dehydrogenase/leucine dehydrogenase
VIENTNYSPDVSRKYTVADMITGYGVAIAAKHFYDIKDDSINGKRVVVQGFGNVGAAAAFYFAQMGAKVVGIIDKVGGIINEEGFSFKQITDLYLNKIGNTLMSDQLLPFEDINDRIWSLQNEVFAPCAASRLVTKDQIDQMIDTGLEVITCGANVPFADKEIFFGSIMAYTDQKVSLIPDFISNCGMARVFAYFMERKVQMTDEAIFNDTSKVIRKALIEVHKNNPTKTGVSETAFEIALRQLI